MSLLAEPVTKRSDVPEKVWKVTESLLATHPPSNPIVLMNAAEWWYKNGRGANDPAFKYAVRWMDYSINDNIAAGGDGDDVYLFGEVRDYLRELREAEEVEV